MTSTIPAPVNGNQLSEASKAESGLDVDWLIHKKDPHISLKRTKSASDQSRSRARTLETESQAPPVQTPHKAVSARYEDGIDPVSVLASTQQSNGTPKQPVPSINEPKPAATPQPVQKAQTPQSQQRPTTPQQTSPPEESKHSRLSLKKDGRRSSWFSSLGSKLSGSDKTARNSSVSSQSSKTKSPQPSPAVEKSNPFETQKFPAIEAGADEKPVHVGPRRPSVLVAAGTETKLDQPGFLTSALRRLSSSNTAQLGKAAGTGAVCPRRTLNIDNNRQRTRIPDFDQNKLRRVAFKVDVEIAGIAAQADEVAEDPKKIALNDLAAAYGRPAAATSKDSKMAKYKDRSEGAALKKTTSREAKEDQVTVPKVTSPTEEQEEEKQELKKEQVEKDIKQEVRELKQDDQKENVDDKDKPSEPTTTRKKEKKKRSEAERKERKEKKRKQAVANGLIPLEITIDDEDSDSSNGTPPGANTPRKGQPTTDPLRIYKRCCQLRETQALNSVKDQISRPSATLAETPGTVAVVDLSGAEMTLADVQTLGDWLAVVPVRKLVLDGCGLSDEAVRIILSGLSGCKSQDQIRANRKLPRRGSGKQALEEMGIIERLSMKNNSAISAIGWKHIALFIHLCRSLRAIDLTGIPFPTKDLSRTSTTTSTNMSTSQELPSKPLDLNTLFAQALADRFGTRLEELILSGCGLSSNTISEIVDSAIACRIKRLGLAANNMNEEAIRHVVRYVTSGICEGLDMGANDLNGMGHLLTEVLNEQNPMFAMSLADCNLSVQDLRSILQHLSLLRNFKFLDLSRNHELFESPEDVISLLRRRLPQMKGLKRVHLADVDLTPNQLISLAEIFPDCPSLAHVSVLDNQKLVECMNSKQGEAQEEACAFFVSLMTAVRQSKTLVAVEIEVPSQESSEVIKALSSQVVAYSLRNLESTTLTDFLQDKAMPEKLDKQPPEVLLHLVGHMEGYSENHDRDEPAPDADYMMATNGIVKALGVCLTNKESSRIHSRNMSPAASGTATPRRGLQGPKKPKDVSLDLCESARKIRLRLRPAMIKEDQAGNSDAYRRLMALDQTLERTIKRFEDEYPESRPKQSPSMLSLDSGDSSHMEPMTSGPLSRLTSLDDDDQRPQSEQQEDPYSLKLSRTGSNTSLAARALTQEEGRMHRFGQVMRREVIKPHGTDDVLHGTSIYDPPEPDHLQALRNKLEQVNGEDIRREVEKRGADDVVKELGLDLEQLRLLEHEDPEAFETLKNAQLAAQLNTNLTGRPQFSRETTINGQVTN